VCSCVNLIYAVLAYLFIEFYRSVKLQMSNHVGFVTVSCIKVFVNELFIIKALSAEATRPLSRILGEFVFFLHCIYITTSSKYTAHWYCNLLVLKHRTNLLQHILYIPVYHTYVFSITLVGLRGSAVERQSLANVLSPSCARPVADG